MHLLGKVDPDLVPKDDHEGFISPELHEQMMAENPDRLRARIELISEAEIHRPKCLRCGTNLTFMKVQPLDNSPLNDSIFKEPFEVLPAYCESCGKYEFYNPVIIRKNKYLAYLVWKDTQE